MFCITLNLPSLLLIRTNYFFIMLVTHLKAKQVTRYLLKAAASKLLGIHMLFFVILHPFNPFPNKPWFLCVSNISPLKTLWEKEKLLVTSNFSFSHSVLYLFGKLFAICIKFEIVFCKLLQFGRV